MNLGEARTELGERGFDYLSASRMNTMLNKALVDFEDYYAWPWLRKQTSGPAPLPISDLKYVRSVFDSTGTEYFGLDDSDDVYRPDIGTPTGWWIDDTSGSPVLTAYQVGSVSFIVNYVATSSPLTTDTDTPKIPAAYHTTWVDLAVVQAYKDSDNFAAAGALRNMALGDLQGIVERYETRNRMNSRQRLVRAGSEDE